MNGNTTVPLIAPQTQFEGRRSQLDVRLTKLLKRGARARLQANLDLYNVLNGSAILAVNGTFGPQWLRPIASGSTGTAILNGRLIEFSGQLTF